MGSIATELAAAVDPVILARQAGVEPDDWQADVLRSPQRRALLNCCRQSGKSSTAAILGTHAALYQPGALVLLLSPALRQSQEAFRKCLDVYRSAGRPVAPEAENRLTLELSNGSRIVSLPGSERTIRGFSGVDLLIADEASRIEDSLYASTLPMLAVSGGKLVALSTPWGRRGWWSDAWHSDEDWQRVTLTAYDCPRISDAEIEAYRRAVGDFWFRQEFLCEFLDAETAAFRAGDIEAAIREDVEPWNLTRLSSVAI